MKTAAKTLVPVLALLSLVLGCSVIERFKKQAQVDTTRQVVTSKDNKTQLTVPGSWDKQLNVNPVASLQAGDFKTAQFAIVITEIKDNFQSSITLQKYTNAAETNARNNLMVKDMQVGDAISATVGGYPAMQFEATGTAAGMKLNWIYTIIETPSNYHQVLTWTTASDFERNKPLLLEVTNSFKEIASGSVTEPPKAANKK